VAAARSAVPPHQLTAGTGGSGGGRPGSRHRDMDWMELSGYGATLASNGDGETVIEVHNCVYRELSRIRTSSPPSAPACSAACSRRREVHTRRTR
jgi:hypothetical protein